MKLIAKIKEIIFSEKFSVIMVVLSLICFVLAIAFFVVFRSWKFSTTIDETIVGQFGDFVGGVIGTLLAFAASLLYYIALKEQQKDVKTNQKALEKQVEEFSNQVKELELSREVYKQQSRTMLYQQFENNFYSYFDIYLKVKAQLSEGIGGKDYFSKAMSTISAHAKYKDLQGKDSWDAYNYLVDKYEEYFVTERESFSHYFRTFYRLLTIVTSNPVFKNDENERMKYIKIIRSQMNERELLLLYYNAHSSFSGKAKNLIYKYNILKHLPTLNKIEIKNKYQLSKNAYIKLSSLFNFADNKIVDFVNQVCDNIEDDLMEEYNYPSLKCILSLKCLDELTVSYICSDLRILPGNFSDIVLDCLYDVIFISQFNYQKDAISFATTKDLIIGVTTFEYKISIDKINRISQDINYGC